MAQVLVSTEFTPPPWILKRKLEIAGHKFFYRHLNDRHWRLRENVLIKPRICHVFTSYNLLLLRARYGLNDVKIELRVWTILYIYCIDRRQRGFVFMWIQNTVTDEHCHREWARLDCEKRKVSKHLLFSCFDVAFIPLYCLKRQKQFSFLKCCSLYLWSWQVWVFY